MPTLFTHAVVGATAAAVAPKTKTPVRLWGVAILCAVLPDADVLAFRLGIPYEHFFGHRGFFHSWVFACILGILCVVLFFGPRKLISRQGLFLALFFSAVACTHGILDAFTNGGLGIALLSPFDTERYFFWSTPIQVSPINPARFFTARGVRVMTNEILCVWLPAIWVLFTVKTSCFLKRRYRKPQLDSLRRS